MLKKLLWKKGKNKTTAFKLIQWSTPCLKKWSDQNLPKENHHLKSWRATSFERSIKPTIWTTSALQLAAPQKATAVKMKSSAMKLTWCNRCGRLWECGDGQTDVVLHLDKHVFPIITNIITFYINANYILHTKLQFNKLDYEIWTVFNRLFLQVGLLGTSFHPKCKI